MRQTAKKPILYLIPCNHFDLAWRRPFRSNMVYEGKTFIPYAKIEQYYIEDNIELCKKYPQYKFTVESVAVCREFLKNRPDMREELENLSREGKVFIAGSGDNIIDANLVLGETVVRNMVAGLLWTEENFSQKNRQAFRADAFGNSAQLPQIFRGCELDHVFMLNYVEPDGKYWRGLDGSVVVCGFFENSGNGGNPYKLTPCKTCDGVGEKDSTKCPTCNGRGINSEREKLFFFPFKVKEELLEENGVGFIMLAPEEYLPKEETVKRALEFKEKFDVRFVTPEEPLDELCELFDNIENPDESLLNSSNELNPSNTGCYVTRIKSKQTMRRQEYALLGSESLAVMAWLCGDEYPKEELDLVWQDLFYMAFHDCVTGTVVDAAYKELEDVREKIDAEIKDIRIKSLSAITESCDNVITVINRFGVTTNGVAFVDLPREVSSVHIFDATTDKEVCITDIKNLEDKTVVYFMTSDIEPFGIRKYYWKESENNVSILELDRNYIENNRFTVTADENGIVSIYDKKQKKEVAKSGEYHVGELIFEHDEGSPWATLSSDLRRTPLSERTKLKKVEKGSGFERMTFETRPLMGYTQHDVSATVTVTLRDSIDRVDFHSSVYWNSYNHRLRVAFPSTISGKHLYGIPYGINEREPYEPVYNWSGVNGDYPAVDFAGIDDGKSSFAVLNRGIPSYMIEKGEKGDTLYLSLLRSPTVPTFLHEPNYYSMTEWDGMRDAGRHEFDYSLVAYDTTLSESKVQSDAINFNVAPIAVNGTLAIPEIPKINSENVYCSSLKKAENRDALVMRLVEYRGESGKAEIFVPAWAKEVYKVNLLERQEDKLEVKSGKTEISVRPFEILTLLFTR